MALVVQKYGGSSVGTIDRIRNVARRLIDTQRDGNQVVAVISAMSGVTDQLIGLAHQVMENPPERMAEKTSFRCESVILRPKSAIRYLSGMFPFIEDCKGNCFLLQKNDVFLYAIYEL